VLAAGDRAVQEKGGAGHKEEADAAGLHVQTGLPPRAAPNSRQPGNQPAYATVDSTAPCPRLLLAQKAASRWLAPACSNSPAPCSITCSTACARHTKKRQEPAHSAAHDCLASLCSSATACPAEQALHKTTYSSGQAAPPHTPAGMVWAVAAPARGLLLLPAEVLPAGLQVAPAAVHGPRPGRPGRRVPAQVTGHAAHTSTAHELLSVTRHAGDNMCRKPAAQH
jgi:hypothetical protein